MTKRMKKKRGKFPGVRYEESPDKKYQGKPDRYYTIRFTVHGKQKEEGLGWASEGWNDQKALERLASLKENHRTGNGPVTLGEARREAQKKVEAKQRAGLTFGQFWQETYSPQSQRDKAVKTWKREKSFFSKWLKPLLADLPLKDISPIHLEKLKSRMKKAGLAPRSIQYVLALVRQVFNVATRLEVYEGKNPATQVKVQKFDNERQRFLSPEEAKRLLEALAQVSNELHDMALLSLCTGMRAGEIFSLTWGDVDLERDLLSLRNTKNKHTRYVRLIRQTRAIFEARNPGDHDNLVFPGRKGVVRQVISKRFYETADRLFNQGVKDRARRVTFHTLRHTFASWLVEDGRPLYTVGKLLGHRTAKMTERYAHLAPDHMQDSMKTIEDTFIDPEKFAQAEAVNNLKG